LEGADALDQLVDVLVALPVLVAAPQRSARVVERIDVAALGEVGEGEGHDLFVFDALDDEMKLERVLPAVVQDLADLLCVELLDVDITADHAVVDAAA